MSQEIDTSMQSAEDKVFAIDELREEILKYAMFDNLGKISGKMVGTVRVVNKSWLQSSTKLLRKSKESVIKLILGKNKKTVTIKRLVETFGASPRLQESFLPLKLDVRRQFFRERNYKSLSDCLTRLENELVEIQMDYPKDGGTMPVTFPPFSLPQLRKLSFQFSRWKLGINDGEDVFGNNQNGLGLLQTILNASNAISDLMIPFNRFIDDEVPLGFKHLQLPATISSLNMRVELKSKDIDVLLRNQLPNLSHFTLRVHDVPPQGFLFKILEPFRKTLQTLIVEGFMNNGGSKPHTHLRFPVMEKLNEIDIDFTKCELGPGNVTDLQKFLPELTVVKLCYQTKAGLAKWTQDSRFEKVKELSVFVVNEELDDDDDSYFMSPGPTAIIQLQQAFPNVRNLSLRVNISDLTGLKYVFRDMAQLNTLTIQFFGDGEVLHASYDLIDSVFLGLPLRLVVALKEDMHLMDTGKITINDGGEPSIRNLSELIALTLETFCALEENGRSLISNLLFRQAIMKMTKLRKLDLHDNFRPSLEMEEEWKGHGRFIKYFPE